MTQTILGEGRDAVLLTNMGGPRALDEVRPFLREIFLDPAIIGAPAFVRIPLANLISTLRAPIARRRYRKIGGRSPVADALSAQARALARNLRDRGCAIRVAWGMRYSAPAIARVLDELAAPGIERLVLVPLFPQYSSTTTATVEDLVRAWWDAKGFDPSKLRIVRSFPTLPGLITAWCDRIRAALGDLPPDAHILFTAHSIPMSRVRAGDPYPAEVRATVGAIVSALPVTCPYALGFQSRFGPVRWLGPRIEKVLRDAARAGMRAVAIVPVSFVCENLETRYDLEIKLRAVAAECGIAPYAVAHTPGDDTAFIAGLAEEIAGSLS